jgi:hypothetical protein
MTNAGRYRCPANAYWRYSSRGVHALAEPEVRLPWDQIKDAEPAHAPGMTNVLLANVSDLRFSSTL